MFEKNLEILTREEAEKIRGIRAAVIGLGALGQMAAQMLVRSGFERLILCDGDRMERSNLNRQLYADIMTMGMQKTDVVSERLCDISPRLKIKEYGCFLSEENGREMDSIPVKLYLEELAGKLRIPLVHGAVEGWFGQVCTVLPGRHILSVIYEKKREQKVSALMPAVCLTASVQASEALLLAAGGEPQFGSRLFCADLKTGEFDSVALSAATVEKEGKR